jgi:hypothetical protein
MIRLLDSEWERIREHFPEENISDGRRGMAVTRHHTEQSGGASCPPLLSRRSGEAVNGAVAY